MAPADAPVWHSPVADFPGLLHLGPASVGPDADLAAIVDAFSRDTTARSVFVTDAADRLLGAISETQLDSDLMLVVLPQRLWPSVREMDTRELVRAARGNSLTAKDLMKRCLHVKAETALQDAIVDMLRSKQPVVAIVDDEERLLGYLSLFEALAEMLRRV